MWDVVLISFAIGFLTKIADMIADDGLRANACAGYAVGIIYGSMLSYIIFLHPTLSPLVIAVVLGALFTGKIDHPIHYLGMGSMILFLAVFGMPGTDVILLAAFMVAGVLDEVVSDLADRKKIRGTAATLLSKRPVMDISALIVSLSTGSWIFFIAMFSANAGYTYLFPERLRGKLISLGR